MGIKEQRDKLASIKKVISLFFFVGCIYLFADAQYSLDVKDDDDYSRGGIHIGVSNRFNNPINEPMHIRYIHESGSLRDTFDYQGKLNSRQNMITLVLGLGANKRYYGLNLDYGFVPFAKRTNHLNIQVYGLIPLKKRKIMLAPTIGYTFFRKSFNLGWMEQENNKLIIGSNAYSELKIRAINDFDSYTFGLDIRLKSTWSISLTRHIVSNEMTAVRVLGYKSNSGSGNLFYPLFPSDRETYKNEGSKVIFTDMNNQPVKNLIQPYNWSVSLVYILDPNNIEGDGWRPFKGLRRRD